MTSPRPLPGNSALLVIDVQERLVAAMNDPSRCVRATSQLLIGANALSVPTVVTQQYPKGLGPTVEALEPHIANATLIDKMEFDASEVEAVQVALNGRANVVVAGMEAHICVHQTVRGLIARGHHVIVASDATCSRDPDHHRIAEGLWRDSGAQVSCAEAALFDWLGKAGGDAFKTISRAIR